MSLFRFPDVGNKTNQTKSEVVKAAVVPCSYGAGASYVSSKLLQEGLIAHHTPAGLRTLVELGTPYFFDALGMEQRFKERDFFYYEASEKYRINTELDINWYLRENSEPLAMSALFKVLAMAPGNMIVYDCSGLQNSSNLEKIVCEMDIIYLVIDPLPTKLLSSESFIKGFTEKYPECVLLVNKFNKGIHKAQLSSFLGTNNYYTIPAADLSHIYSAEYNCVLP